MAVLLFVYGTESGTWVDEHSSLLIDAAGHGVDMPSFAPAPSSWRCSRSCYSSAA